ncbi:MAG: nicotinate (nicotinamide) nucleotide adenylyltransferase [Deltaproteobacteria bacterium]|nr:nicotinate (nicotinamide) nucleotide adenylyltransferase [Deltaproteobacteria bacterium]
MVADHRDLPVGDRSERRNFVTRVGIFGGTFDPPHYGHLRSAEEVRELLRLDRILFVVASVPPHKDRVVSEFDTRHELTSLAIEDHPYFVATDVERLRPGKSYTVETLLLLRDQYSTTHSKIFFLLGSDSFYEITTWKSYQRIPELASLVILNRPGFEGEAYESFLKATFPGYEGASGGEVFLHPEKEPVFFLDTTLLEISSTDIRKRVLEGRSIRYLVPEAVRKTIQQKGLYRS